MHLIRDMSFLECDFIILLIQNIFEIILLSLVSLPLFLKSDSVIMTKDLTKRLNSDVL